MRVREKRYVSIRDTEAGLLVLFSLFLLFKTESFACDYTELLETYPEKLFSLLRCQSKHHVMSILNVSNMLFSSLLQGLCVVRAEMVCVESPVMKCFRSMVLLFVKLMDTDWVGVIFSFP